MKIISGNQGSGKTRALVAEASHSNGVIVCRDVERMIEKIHAYGYIGIDVVSYDEFIENALWKDGRKYYVRRAEELLEALNVESASITIN